MKEENLDPLITAIIKISAGEKLTDEEQALYSEFAAKHPVEDIKIDGAVIKRMMEAESRVQQTWNEFKNRYRDRLPFYKPELN